MSYVIEIPEYKVKLTITAEPLAPTEPDIKVISFVMTPEIVMVGATWTGTAIVRNDGAAGSKEVSLGYIGTAGTKKALLTETVTLDPGATKTLTISGTASITGDWTFYADELTAILHVVGVTPSAEQYDVTFDVKTKTGLAIEGATVTLTGQTSSTGSVTLGPVGGGAYEYTVSSSGYKTITGIGEA